MLRKISTCAAARNRTTRYGDPRATPTNVPMMRAKTQAMSESLMVVTIPLTIISSKGGRQSTDQSKSIRIILVQWQREARCRIPALPVGALVGPGIEHCEGVQQIAHGNWTSGAGAEIFVIELLPLPAAK